VITPLNINETESPRGSSGGVYRVESGSSATKGARSLKRVGKVQNRLSDITDDYAITMPRIVTPEGSPGVTRRSYAMYARRVEQNGDQESQLGSADDLIKNDSHEWMDVSKFGSVFSHQGSSLYLRLGALGKWILYLNKTTTMMIIMKVIYL